MENISEENSSDDFGMQLDKELEEKCGLADYVDFFEMEEKTDEELKLLPVETVLEFKNSQIAKLKQYIASLEAEKRDLTENYKKTTDSLLEKVKLLEFKQKGVRPETARIARELPKNPSKKEELKRCTQCTELFLAEDLMEHSLNCIRHMKRCSYCSKAVKEEEMDQHLIESRTTV